MWPSGSKSMENGTGPSMEPWGTPQEIGAEKEVELLIEKLKDLLYYRSNEENQFKREPEIHTHLICEWE